VLCTRFSFSCGRELAPSGFPYRTRNTLRVFRRGLAFGSVRAKRVPPARSAPIFRGALSGASSPGVTGTQRPIFRSGVLAEHHLPQRYFRQAPSSSGITYLLVMGGKVW